MDAVVKAQKEDIANRKAKRFCTKVGKFLLITVGLLAINCGYLIGGAYLFKYLEITNEQQNCREAKTQYEEAREKSLGGMPRNYRQRFPQCLCLKYSFIAISHSPCQRLILHMSILGVLFYNWSLVLTCN